MSSNEEKKDNQDKRETFLSFNFWGHLIRVWSYVIFLVTIYNFLSIALV